MGRIGKFAMRGVAALALATSAAARGGVALGRC